MRICPRKRKPLALLLMLALVASLGLCFLSFVTNIQKSLREFSELAAHTSNRGQQVAKLAKLSKERAKTGTKSIAKTTRLKKRNGTVRFYALDGTSWANSGVTECHDGMFSVCVMANSNRFISKQKVLFIFFGNVTTLLNCLIFPS